MRQEARKHVGEYAAALLASGLLAIASTEAIVASAGEYAVPLDDAFIHFQYARRLAEGHFFSYVPGAGYSSGATSFLWPVLLAPFYALGFHDVRLILVAWLFGTVAHAGVAVEARRITYRLAGGAAAAGTSAMCLLFGAFAWFAWSGMETIALAWMLLRTARVAGGFCEPSYRGAVPSERELILLGVVTPLVRPEGAIASLVAALALGLKPRGRGFARRTLAVLPLAGPALVPMLNYLMAGHATSSTATVKWMVLNPYYGGPYLVSGVLHNAHLLLANILNGGEWTAIFLPEHAVYPIVLGLVALPVAALRRRVPFHALFLAAVLLGTFVPCTYMSFLWNRLRYVWPFAGAWFVLLGCLAREIGDLVRYARPRCTFVTPLIAGAFAGILGIRLPLAIDDLARSARAIDRQQVALGRWARENLPEGARIGVNDTGAIAYLSDRETFDVVGLTTEGQARYWAGGPASRFEHYEQMPRRQLPTHFIVYPEWMACPVLLGTRLHEATVLDQSILGGVTMGVYAARYDALGTGARPATPPPGATLVDEVDVADLDSEQAHAFDLHGAFDVYEIVSSAELGPSEGEAGEENVPREIADGGRQKRTLDRFRVQLPAMRKPRMVLRVGADEDVDLEVAIGGNVVGSVVPNASEPWSELTLDLPAEVTGASQEVSVRARPRTTRDRAVFTSYHYWFYSSS
jgi:hypothetical protein